MSMMFSNTFQPPFDTRQPVIKVLGLGGGGSNAINRMIELGLRGVEYIAANTDHQALENCLAPVKIQLGPKVTRGLGAGGDPRVGQAAAQESCREIEKALTGADMVFLTAGMGGGTGTGSISVAAEISRQIGAVTIAVVTTPFSFEMGRRQRNANEGLGKLQNHTNTLISIPNDRLLYVAPRNLPMEVAFRMADDVLRQSVQGITELITQPGMINVDFAHVRRLMMLGGGAIMSIGQGQGEGKARGALEQALHHPLLETVALTNAQGIIANFTGGLDLTLYEVEAALTYLQEQTGYQAEIVMGVTNDDYMEDRTQVILIITGLGAPTLEEAMAKVSQPAAQPRPPAPASTVEAFPPSPSYSSPEPLRQVDAFSEPRPAPAAALPQVSGRISAQDLDVPAFLRRRTRYNGRKGIYGPKNRSLHYRTNLPPLPGVHRLQAEGPPADGFRIRRRPPEG
jgi:cell division protein FtsZ